MSVCSLSRSSLWPQTLISSESVSVTAFVTLICLHFHLSRLFSCACAPSAKLDHSQWPPPPMEPPHRPRTSLQALLASSGSKCRASSSCQGKLSHPHSTTDNVS